MTTQLTAKYRPQKFSEVIGQEYIKKILSRAAQEDRVAHVYLFSGTRGVGKTTVARILAKAVNCEDAPVSEPCNNCTHCKSITKGNFPDVIEIDGASHTGVDNVRKLREDVFLPPISGRYKVIIIDEAHMLSKAAFNALLKTLEEPPKHCIFIFATTEPERFPITIVSRSQHYVFNSLSQYQIQQHLEYVLNQEGIKFESQAVQLIARRADGSVRDAMSLLAQVLALSDGELLEVEVRQILGLVGDELFQKLFELIAKQDLVEIHKTVEYLREQGLDLGFFLREFALYWRNLFLLAKLRGEANKILNWDETRLKIWLNMVQQFSLARIHASWQIVLEGQRSILKNIDPVLSLELLLFNLACLAELVNVEDDINSITPSKKKQSEPVTIASGEKKNVFSQPIIQKFEKEKSKIKNFKDELKKQPLIKGLMDEFGAMLLHVKQK
ncbi:MAG: DNA polymerase III subunit gamma/tau [Desulfonauticus sp.]|nr:DNA polymerase III subunit gamma/tau [Desulfonauticus sp.]